MKSISEHSADVLFEDAKRTVSPETSGLQPAEAHAALNGLEMPLQLLMEQVVGATLTRLGVEKPDSVVTELGPRWLRGKLVMHPADPTLQTKEVPMEVWFHKIVGIRNQLRVLEQKINAHETLNDGEKVEMQQYITRCYGSLTTFTIWFREKEGQF